MTDMIHAVQKLRKENTTELNWTIAMGTIARRAVSGN